MGYTNEGGSDVRMDSDCRVHLNADLSGFGIAVPTMFGGATPALERA